MILCTLDSQSLFIFTFACQAIRSIKKISELFFALDMSLERGEKISNKIYFHFTQHLKNTLSKRVCSVVKLMVFKN